MSTDQHLVAARDRLARLRKHRASLAGSLTLVNTQITETEALITEAEQIAHERAVLRDRENALALGWAEVIVEEAAQDVEAEREDDEAMDVDDDMPDADER
jgi:hypothetical protein